MTHIFREKYMPQVAIYKEVIKKRFVVTDSDIKMGIISFSFKDSSGNKLPDEGLRVRFTDL